MNKDVLKKQTEIKKNMLKRNECGYFVETDEYKHRFEMVKIIAYK